MQSGGNAQSQQDRDTTAWRTTLSCLMGCGVGDLLGIVIGTVLSAALGFMFGYVPTVRSLLRSGLAPRAALPLALGADALSTAIMEIAHAGLTFLLSGAAHVGPHSIVFWVGLFSALAVAAFAAYPANRWLISRATLIP